MAIDQERNSAATKSNSTLKEPKPNMDRRPSAQFKVVGFSYLEFTSFNFCCSLWQTNTKLYNFAPLSRSIRRFYGLCFFSL